MIWLRKAKHANYADPDTYRNETALDPLRVRNDFQQLMRELDGSLGPH